MSSIRTTTAEEFRLRALRNISENKSIASHLLEDIKAVALRKRSPVPAQPTKRRKTEPLFLVEPRRNPSRSVRIETKQEPRTRQRTKTQSKETSESLDDDICAVRPQRILVKFGSLGRMTHLRSDENENILPDDDDESLKVYDEEESDIEIGSRRRPRLTVPEVTEEDLKTVAVSSSEKRLDSEYGTCCHQCRQKTLDTKTICRSEQCVGIRGMFCGPCLRNRYGEDAVEALKDKTWICPPCRGTCNCSICRRRSGKSCTGILVHIARENGFSDVDSYLHQRAKC